MVKFLIDNIVKIHGSTIRYNQFFKKLKIDSLVRAIIVLVGNCILPYIRSSSKLNEYNENQKIDGKKIIVSLTTFPARINKVSIVIESLINQTHKPNKIILWLSKDQFKDLSTLPPNLIKYLERGLDIRFVDGDIKSHKKYFYSFQEYPHDLVILVDDDILYESTFVEHLIEGMDDSTIKCRYAFRITKSSDGKLLPYSEWPFISEKSRGNDIFFGTGGGSIFIPSSLPNDTLNLKKIMSLCPKADDVWLNAMVRLGGIKIVKEYTSIPYPIINHNSPTLYQENVGLSMNDQQLNRIQNEYGNLMSNFQE